MDFVNLTPHAIVLNDGQRFEPTGSIARVSADFTEMDGYFCEQKFGEIENLPAAQDGVVYIVSGIVKSATERDDVVAPATGHPKTVRDDKGHILSVPGFVK